MEGREDASPEQGSSMVLTLLGSPKVMGHACRQAPSALNMGPEGCNAGANALSCEKFLEVSTRQLMESGRRLQLYGKFLEVSTVSGGIYQTVSGLTALWNPEGGCTSSGLAAEACCRNPRAQDAGAFSET